MVIQLIGSNKYTADVCSYIKDNQSCILNSGVYYEDSYGLSTSISLSSHSFASSHRKWLTTLSHVQLVLFNFSSHLDRASWFDSLLELLEVLSSEDSKQCRCNDRCKYTFNQIQFFASKR